MKQFFAALSLFFSSQVFAQDYFNCGTNQMEQKARAADPTIVIEEAKLKQYVADWIAANPDNLRDAAQYTIPLVFHIIHDYGTENITDAQVRDAVSILNEDYQKMNADTSDVALSFKNLIGNVKVQFRLANKDNSGNCTTGIEHIHSLSTYQGGDNAKLNDWPRNKYLNVWTVKEFGADLLGVAGYAYLPPDVAAASQAPYDGVIILSNYVGSIGTGSGTTSRSLTHEIGHVLGLPHTWGNTNSPGVDCGDDGFDDTPETKGWTSCNINGSVCNPPTIENVQNYMEYSYCSMMFTPNQVQQMQGVLNSPTASRNNLSTTTNLNATGTNDTIEPLCAPKADFYSTYKMVCTGASVFFHDVSWGGAATSRSWTFQDGTPATSTDLNPSVTFSTPGWKTVTLMETNASGSNTSTKANYIFISDGSVAQYPVAYWEDFSSPSTFNNDWVVFNSEGNSSLWKRVTTAGYYSSSCVELNNYNNMQGDIDDMISPSFDLSGGGNLYLDFRYTCANHTTNAANVDDVLQIWSTINCGQTWTLRSTISGSTLANAGYSSGSYTPNSNSPWVGKSILLTSALFKPNVRFKFTYKTNGHGNNCYIDNIQISTNPVGIHDPAASTFVMNVFPNPLTENSVVVMNQEVSANVRVYIVDIAGRTLKVLNDGWLGEGEHRFDLNASELGGSGIYFLVANDGTGISRQKLVVQ